MALRRSSREHVPSARRVVAIDPQWHASLGDPTIADAVLDRLVHNAFALTLKGPSRRPDKAGPR